MPLFGLVHGGDEVDVVLEPLSAISSGCSRRFALRFSLALKTSSISFFSSFNLSDARLNILSNAGSICLYRETVRCFLSSNSRPTIVKIGWFSAMSSELLPTMKILLFLREAKEQMKHLELLLTIFFWVRSIGNLWEVWQHLAKEAMNLRGKLMSSTNYWYVIGFRANNRQRVIGAFCNFHVNSKQRETNGVRV